MPVDPQARAILDVLKQLNGPPLNALEPAVARAFSAARRLPPGPDAAVQDHIAPGPGGELPVRIYRPLAATGPLPAVVYFHGGGFVLGSLDGPDAMCRVLAVDADCLVASVDYRLAPEHKFPAAVEDAFAATRWLFEHAAKLGIDRTRVAVAGESAGGNLAAVVAALAKAARGPCLVLQVLLCPVTDLRSLDTPSYAENAEGYLLTAGMMAWFRDHYLSREEQRFDPRCSPLAATDLAGLPPALVITAGYDPLRDEGEAYARALEAAGVAARVSRYDGMIHTFTNLYAHLDQGRVALREVTAALREAFARA